MGKTYTSSAQFEKTPIVRLKDKVGTTFIGTKLKEKPGKQPGTKVFEFAIKGGDADTITSNKKDDLGHNLYESVPVNVGDTVAIFSDTQLLDKLSQVPVNETVKITYNGKIRNPKSGRDFNDYTVEGV